MKKRAASRPPKISLWLRILCGGYLLYLAYGLLPAMKENPLYIVAAVVFVLVGLVLAILSIVKLCKREYIDTDARRRNDSNNNSEEQTDEQ